MLNEQTCLVSQQRIVVEDEEEVHFTVVVEEEAGEVVVVPSRHMGVDMRPDSKAEVLTGILIEKVKTFHFFPHV